MTQTDSDPRPLVVTSDPAVLDDLLRLCAAAGVTPEVAADAAQARRSWPTASCVVVAADRLASLVRAVDRRDGVLIVAPGAADANLWRHAVELGAEGVFALPEDEPSVVELLSASTERADHDAAVVAVIGGTGGAGASTLAAATAISVARRRRSALLVDADPLGGGIDMVVGSEDARGLRWPDLAATHGRVSGDSLRQVLPRLSGLSVLSWSRGDAGDLEAIPRESMRSVLAAGRRSHDAIVVDLPRRLDDAAEEALVRATCLLLVVPAEVRAIAAAQRVLAQVRPLCADVRLVVRGPGPTGLAAGTVAETMRLPLLTSVRTDRKLAELVDDGVGPLARRRTALASACAIVLDELGLLGLAAA